MHAEKELLGYRYIHSVKADSGLIQKRVLRYNKCCGLPSCLQLLANSMGRTTSGLSKIGSAQVQNENMQVSVRHFPLGHWSIFH